MRHPATLTTLAVLLVPRLALAQCPDGTPPPCRAAARGGPRASAQPALPGSIAVLPFTNRSADSTDAYLAEALPEQIIGRLARIGQLQVKSATAIGAQWRRTPDPMAAARALRVEWFVTGSVRRVGRQLAVSAELVRAASGDGAWSAPFRRGDDDLAAIEEQIAESIAVGIVGRLAPEQLAALRRTPSRNVEAYRLYLQGRALVSRRTGADIHRGVEALQLAIRLDPAFAAAWARLGYARGLQQQWGNEEGLETDSLVALARAATDRALQLDSNLSEAWLSLGSLAITTSAMAGNRAGAPRRGVPDLADVHRAFVRAVRLDSLNADIWHGLGYLYGAFGLMLPDEAEPLLRRALELDPDLRNSWRMLADAHAQRGQLAEAEALADSALARGPWAYAYERRAWYRYHRGNGDGALADLAEAERLTGLPTVAVAALPARRFLYLLATGDSSWARGLLSGLRAEAAAGRTRLVDLATWSMALGFREEAVAALERLRATPDPAEPRCGGAPCSVSLRTWRALHEAAFIPIRGDPRIQQLMAETRPRIPWLP